MAERKPIHRKPLAETDLRHSHRNAREVLKDFDIVREAHGADYGIVRQFTGIRAGNDLQLEFVPATALPPLIYGVKGERSDRGP